MLKSGNQAPLEIEILDQAGNKVSLSSLAGKYIALFFYPADFTAGCTLEACSFRDYYSQISELGANVVGVSKDSADSHQKFAAKHKLPYTLWSDPEHKLMEAFGTWNTKRFFFKTHKGTLRSTFIIDPEGKIIAVWKQANPLTNAREVFEFLKNYLASNS